MTSPPQHTDRAAALRSRLHRRISRHRRRALSPQASVSSARCTKASSPAANCKPGRSIATTIRAASPSRTPHFSRAAKIPRSAWLGANASSITTATARSPAASRNGCAWSKPPASRASKRYMATASCPPRAYAVHAYVDFVSTRSHLEAVASSLTELFSKNLIALRMDRLRQHYPWLSSGLDYFTGRLTQAPEDADFALAWVVNTRTRANSKTKPTPPSRQVRHPVGAARRPLFRLRKSRLAAPRRFRPSENQLHDSRSQSHRASRPAAASSENNQQRVAADARTRPAPQRPQPGNRRALRRQAHRRSKSSASCSRSTRKPSPKRSSPTSSATWRSSTTSAPSTSTESTSLELQAASLARRFCECGMRSESPCIRISLLPERINEVLVANAHQ